MSAPIPLLYEHTYHIYNRGNNSEPLFRQERNYHYFMDLYFEHVFPIADTFAYCLLPNHFHFEVRIKAEADIAKVLRMNDPRKSLDPGQNFGNLFNAYTKAVNKVYGRTGSLFEKPFHRKLIETEAYFTKLVLYIHGNPQKHGLIDDFRLWPFSSYGALTAIDPTRLCRDEVIARFGGPDGFHSAHDDYRPGMLGDEFE